MSTLSCYSAQVCLSKPKSAACSCSAGLESHSGYHKRCFFGISQRREKKNPGPSSMYPQSTWIPQHALPITLVPHCPPTLIHGTPIQTLTLSWRDIVTPGTKWQGSPPHHIRNMLQIQCQRVTRALLTGARACLISTVMKVSHLSNLATVPSSTFSYSPAFTYGNPQGWGSWSSTVS